MTTLLTESSDAGESGGKVQVQIDFKTFLETIPPEAPTTITEQLTFTTVNGYKLTPPAVQLHCESPECESTMWFERVEGYLYAQENTWGTGILKYLCRHCGKGWKAFSILFKPQASSKSVVIKVGEYPSFGPHVPSRVISLIGPDRELFLKGRKAENRGLGIGAFAYYRRVVENQKNRIIGEMVKVAKKVGAKPDVINGLEAALTETQFSTAIDSIKTAIPESLLISGHNPLKLVHTALSRGLHEQDDSKCLELAQSIRVVLTELAERIDTILKDQAELSSAISKILQENSRK